MYYWLWPFDCHIELFFFFLYVTTNLRVIQFERDYTRRCHTYFIVTLCSFVGFYFFFYLIYVGNSNNQTFSFSRERASGTKKIAKQNCYSTYNRDRTFKYFCCCYIRCFYFLLLFLRKLNQFAWANCGRVLYL